jgi:uncharacterized protein (DUF2267 family)
MTDARARGAGMSWRDWIGAFAERAGIDDRREAERSARNVAMELGGCLTWRDAQNLADELPEPLASALREGAFGTALARFSARAFVQRVAERDGVGPDQARRRAAALLTLLREELRRSSVVNLDEQLAAWGDGLTTIP